MICLFPNVNDDSYLRTSDSTENKFGCYDNEWYYSTYAKGKDGQPDKKIPNHYDPRCRTWYRDQYQRIHSTFTNVYTYANGKLGITNCVPLLTELSTTVESWLMSTEDANEAGL